MSTATVVDAQPPAGKGKKKLILIAAAAVVVLALAAVVAVVLLKKSAAASAAEAGDDARPAKAAKAEARGTPIFVPLDLFTVNLADREAERYAQVGMTLEIDDGKVGDQIKLYMPAIRNNILMAIADKTAAQLLARDGKLRLALEVRREASRALGAEVPEADDDEAPMRDGAADDGKRKRKKRSSGDEALPIRAVHFNNFIIQ